MQPFLTRLLWWLAAWCVFSVGLICYAIARSQQELAHDPSAMAWTGFLPFLFPLFFLQTGIYLGPAAIFVELMILIRNWLSK